MVRSANGPNLCNKTQWPNKTGGLPIDHGFHRIAPDGTKYPRLSKPVALMRPQYDVVVIGSGYGGGVAASNMARARKSVAVLELGKEKWPGEYPSRFRDAMPELHCSGYLGRSVGLQKDAKLGDKTGLYHLVFGEGQNAFVANGLGGTSLLNANIFLECDSRTRQLDDWPEELREDPTVLDKYYESAREMLQPEPYPESYPTPKKLSVLQQQAEHLGQGGNFYRPPQTTFFKDGLNTAGVRMKASTGSGQDCTGVNDGSKNSVLVTYLADAWNYGAELFCECEVRFIRKCANGEGYIIYYAWHGDERDSFEDEFYTQLMWVRAKELCFLGAGALGTSEILLRSKVRGLQLSEMVGKKVSGNGDMLSFGYNTDEIVNGIGSDVVDDAAQPCGPTITGIIDNRGPETSPNVLDGHVIEEGAIPHALARLIQPGLELMPGKAYPKQYTFAKRLRHFLSRTQALFLGPYSEGSSVDRLQTYLIMSHDSNEGNVTLNGDKPRLQFLGVGRTEHVKELNQVLIKATNAIGGTLINSPFYSAFHQQEAITVHPLGGAIMSSDGTGEAGATNHMGQLFTGKGHKVHRGLICVDGSIIPTALGVNPLATITALAERSIDMISQDREYDIDRSRNDELDLFGKPAVSLPLTSDLEAAHRTLASVGDCGGLRFTEVMDGFVYKGNDIEDYLDAEQAARGSSSMAKLYLSVDIYDPEALIHSHDHAALATGSFSWRALSNDPLLILQGKVQFFVTDESRSDAKLLVYTLKLLSTDKEEYLLRGEKKIDSSMAFSMSRTWKATTVLYTTITKMDGTMVGRGTLEISWRNFVHEMRSFGGLMKRRDRKQMRLIRAIGGFVAFFASQTANMFFSPFRSLVYPIQPEAEMTVETYGDIGPPSKTVTLEATDGVKTTMKVWPARHHSKGYHNKQAKRHLRPILFIPGAAVDDRIFSLPTVPTNTVDYFTSKGYTAYVTTLRFGISQHATHGYTAYDARKDVIAAMKYVREQHGGKKVYVVCHCVGAIATSMALLEGSLPADWVLGMTVSQAFFKLKFGTVNSLKLVCGSQKLPHLYQKLAGSWFPLSSSPNSSLIQIAIDQLLRWYPVGPRSEFCPSTVCHRGSFAFGRLWTHSNLNHSTHEHLDDYFGGLHMNFLSHLTTMGKLGYACDNDFQSLVTEENLARFAKVKILFLSGSQNVVFDPETTQMCYDTLLRRFGQGNVDVFLAEGYGHLDTWMGKDSFRDVYPRVWEHVKEVEYPRS